VEMPVCALGRCKVVTLPAARGRVCSPPTGHITTAVRLASRRPPWRGEAVITVPRPRRKIPRIAVRPVQPISLTDFHWQKLEAALGHVIPERARASITLATNEFLKFAEAESKAGSMEDARRRLKRLWSAAHGFRSAIEERALDDPTRCYVDEWLEMSYEGMNLGDLQDQYVAKLSAYLARFLDACDLTLQRLEQDARYDYWLEGEAWEHWIRQLTAILKEHDLPTAARKDRRSDKSGEASPFALFVFELQSLLPRKLIRSQHSRGALAVSRYIKHAEDRSPP
jgi:hypothetical protein